MPADVHAGWPGPVSRGRARVAAAAGDEGENQLCWNSNVFWLASPEGDDAPDGIVRRYADGHAISGDDLDAEAAHAAAQLGQDLVAGVALHAVQPAAVDRYDGALHVNEIILAQTASVPFLLNNYCATCGR
jgi:hypothetical protein